MAYRALKNYPTTLTIDGDPVNFLIKRLSADEWMAFSHEFDYRGKVEQAAQYKLRPRDEAERALSDDERRAKRWLELTPEERTAVDNEERAEEARGNTFAKESIVAYVLAAPEQVYDETTDQYVSIGEDLVRVFGSRSDVLSDLVTQIFLQNRLSAEQKKKLQSLRASATTSSAPPAAAGERPVPIADNAAPEACAPAAAAMDALDPSPSGRTDRSS